MSAMIHAGPKIGRNDRCPCGSGKKHKKCCGDPLGGGQNDGRLPSGGDPEAVLSGFRAALKGSQVLQELKGRRGLADAQIERFELGCWENRLVFTVRGENGHLLGFKVHKGPHLKPDGTRAGSGEGVPAQLYPHSNLSGDPIWLVEGEPDLWRLAVEDVQALTGTAGAGTWLKEWTQRLKGRDVVVVYDHDEAGRDGQAKAIKALRGVVRRLRVVEWPAELPVGFDLSDWLNNGRSLEDLPLREVEVSRRRENEPARREEVEEALRHLPADDYLAWVEVGMALHHWSQGDGEGLALFDRWSQTTSRGNYKPEVVRQKWASFGKEAGSPLTVATLFKRAQERGWRGGRLGLGSPSLLASKLPLENWKTEPPKGASLSGELFAAPIGGQQQQTTRWTRQTVAALRTTYKPVTWLLEAILAWGSLGLFAGPPGIGKTWLMLSIALAIATGQRWLGRFQVQQGRVLLVLEEDDPNSILERWDKLCAGLGLSSEARDKLPVEFLIQQGVTLVTDAGSLHPELLRHIEEFKPDLLVLDPARRLHNLDENDSGQMSMLLSLLRQELAVRGCSVLLVHHLRKRQDFDEGLDRLRGSSDIAASVDSVLEVGGQFGNLLVKHGKSKRGPALGTFLVHGEINEQAVRLSFLNPDTKAETDRQALRAWLLEALRQGGAMNQSQLCEAGKPKGFGRDRIRRTCEELVGEGAVRAEPGKRNSTRYALVEQFTEGGAGAENNNSGCQEVEVVL